MHQILMEDPPTAHSAMEDDVFLLLSLAELDGADEEDDLSVAMACAAIVCLGLLEACRVQAEKRSLARHYLT